MSNLKEWEEMLKKYKISYDRYQYERGTYLEMCYEAGVVEIKFDKKGKFKELDVCR